MILTRSLPAIKTWTCFSNAGFDSHMVFHNSKQSQYHFTQVLPRQPTGNSCLFQNNGCESTVGLRRSIRVHGGNVNSKNCILTYVIGLARMKLARGVICTTTNTFSRIEMVFLFKVVTVTISCYSFIWFSIRWGVSGSSLLPRCRSLLISISRVSAMRKPDVPASDSKRPKNLLSGDASQCI